MCGACGTRNPGLFLFCGSCAKSLRNVHPAAVPTPEIETAIAEERSANAGLEPTCQECAYAIPEDCQFCVRCGTPLRVLEPEREIVSTSPAVSGPSTSNRIRLRLTLLSSATLLLALAVVLYAIAGRQWAVAPFTLALISAIVSVGKLSRRSLALFTSDMRAAFGGTRV